MKLIVDISEELYNSARDYGTPLPSNLAYEMRAPIANGTPLTDLTNGEVIMKMFLDLKPKVVKMKMGVYLYSGDECMGVYDVDWWNARYEEKS